MIRMSLPCINVISEVVNYDLCIGCGVCASSCPQNILEIRFNNFGEYVACEKNSGCVSGCKLCLNLCPFWKGQGENLDTLGEVQFSSVPDIHHRQELGYYLEAYAGHSRVSMHQQNGASGGMATWLLEQLLKNGIVDAVCCVTPKDIDGELFEFAVLKTVEEVRQSSKSCYYPVEASKVIQYILENQGRYAIIGLPCLTKAIRLAAKKKSVLAERVKYVFGLVCGQGKSSFFAEYVCAVAGGDPGKLQKVKFRVKEKGSERPPKDYGISFACNLENEGVVEKTTYISEIGGNIWPNRYFTPIACNYCDDTFAEVADATFMDAWLPEFANDFLGNSLVLVRSNVLADILKTGIANEELGVHEIDVTQVIKSQEKLLNSKRNLIYLRSAFGVVPQNRVPHLRSSLQSTEVSWLEKQLLKITWQIALHSREQWYRCQKNVSVFEKKMKHLQQRVKIVRTLQKLSTNPRLTLSLIFSVFYRKLTR